MRYVYVLQSQKDNSYYIWYTSNIWQRLQQHNDLKNSWYTKAKQPRNLIYYEAFTDKSKALLREKRLKTWSKARQELFKRIMSF
jgi:putative endonuclease